MTSINYKPQILQALKNKEVEYKTNGDKWKVIAFRKVINQMSKLSQINSIEDVQSVQGVGASILTVIKEAFLVKPSSPTPQQKAIDELTKVHGIGDVKARQLVEQENVMTIEDLKNNQHLLNGKQKIGLKYVEDLELRIPRKEIDKHKHLIETTVKLLDDDINIMFVGSYRRGAADSGDIDILVSHAHNQTRGLLEKIVEALKETGYIKETLSMGEKKFFGISKVKYGRHFRRVDIMITTKEEFPFAVMYFTGSREFNIDLRNHCLKLGMSLNEYGLTHTSDQMGFEKTFETEEALLNCLGFKFIPPEKRAGNILKDYKI